MFAGEAVRVRGVDAGRAGAQGDGVADPAQPGADPPDTRHR